MEYWQELLRGSIESEEQLIERFGFKPEAAGKLNEFFQTRINPYYLSLIRYKGDPIYLQAVPDVIEIFDIYASDDPLNDDAMGTVSSITHPYDDRGLFLDT